MLDETHKIVDTVVKVLSLLAICVGLFFGYTQYSGSLEKEYKKPFWEAQLETCKQASSLAAEIALADDATERATEAEKIFVLFFGQASLTLNHKALDSIRDIGSRAIRCEAGTEKSDRCIGPVFNSLAANVAAACRQTLVESWSVGLEKLGSEQLEFRSEK